MLTKSPAETSEEEITAAETEPEPQLTEADFVKVEGEPEQLTFGENDNAFGMYSPDGQRIAYQSLVEGRWQLFQIDLSVENTIGAQGDSPESGPKYLTIPLLQTDFNDESPVWTTDGAKILYVSDRGSSEAFNRDIFVFDMSMGTTTALTDEPGDDWSPAAFGAESAAFISERSASPSLPPYKKPNGLYTVRLDGSGLKEIAGQDANYCCPVSLDDHRLLVLNSEDRLVELDINTHERKLLTPAQIRCGTASFCPTRGWMVFTGREDSRNGIYVMDVNTSRLTRLASAPGEAVYPQIASDGLWLLYSLNLNGTYQLFRVGLTGE